MSVAAKSKRETARSEAAPDPQPTGRLAKSDWGIAAALAVAVCIVYAQTAGFDYVNYDDPSRVSDNIVVQKGLTLEGVRYSFSSTVDGNFMPATWLSFMAVVEFAGHGPAAQHVVNFLLHASLASLVFLFWRMATGQTGPSAAVAAVFALHPLRVESVAWITERKDTLSTLFGMLSLLAYLHYARKPSPLRYILMAALFAMGLLSKSMLVTLPFVMLLLDFWPLGRWGADRWRAMVMEKLPLFAMSAAIAVITVIVQRQAGSIGSTEDLPIVWRLWNAPASYGMYLCQLVWPVGLALLYPFPEFNVVVLRGALGLVALAIITTLALMGWRKRPYLAMGWLWYLGTLVPVIGLLQAGAQAHADRYTYLPHIGLLVAVVWSVAGFVEGRPEASRRAHGATVVLLFLLSALTWRQAGYWRNSETLFARTLAVTRQNPLAEGSYAAALMTRGDFAGAEQHLRRVIESGKSKASDYHNLGIALMGMGRLADAQASLETAVAQDPSNGRGWALLGSIRLKRGQPPGAVEAFQKAIPLGFDNVSMRVDLALALGLAGKPEEAAAAFDSILAERPDDPTVRFRYGLLLVQQRKMDEAALQFEHGLKYSPEDAGMMYCLGVARATQNRVPEAMTLLRRAASKDSAFRRSAAQDPLLAKLRDDPDFQKFLRER